MRYDCAVIGTGPAGLEAALNLSIRKTNFVLFGIPELSRKIGLAPRIQNYLGLPGVTGGELREAFTRHLEEMGVTITPGQVSVAYPMGDYFSVATGHTTCEAVSLILAPGVFSAGYLPGEQELLGRGVGYCATCDAPLYKGKTVAVVGYTEESVHEANYVAEIAAKVYFIPVGKLQTKPGSLVEVVNGKPLEIAGTGRVEALILQDARLEADGVFLLRESIAPDTLVPGLAVAGGFISVDAAMKTNIPGCFAAGDCTGKPHQYIRAAGQGLVAAHSAVEYIDTKK
jgi:thioredoxin reductase (NADPH)